MNNNIRKAGNSFQTRLQKALDVRNITRNDFSKLTDIDLERINSFLESGESPSLEEFKNIALVLSDFSVEWLQYGTGAMKSTSHVGSMEDFSDMIEKIKQLRISKGLSQAEFGKFANMARSTVSQMEQGKQNPNYYVLRKLHHNWKVDLNWLIAGTAPTKSHGGDSKFKELYEEQKAHNNIITNELETLRAMVHHFTAKK